MWIQTTAIQPLTNQPKTNLASLEHAQRTGGALAGPHVQIINKQEHAQMQTTAEQQYTNLLKHRVAVVVDTVEVVQLVGQLVATNPGHVAAGLNVQMISRTEHVVMQIDAVQQGIDHLKLNPV